MRVLLVRGEMSICILLNTFLKKLVLFYSLLGFISYKHYVFFKVPSMPHANKNRKNSHHTLFFIVSKTILESKSQDWKETYSPWPPVLSANVSVIFKMQKCKGFTEISWQKAGLWLVELGYQ